MDNLASVVTDAVTTPVNFAVTVPSWAMIVGFAFLLMFLVTMLVLLRVGLALGPALRTATKVSEYSYQEMRLNTHVRSAEKQFGPRQELAKFNAVRKGLEADGIKLSNSEAETRIRALVNTMEEVQHPSSNAARI